MNRISCSVTKCTPTWGALDSLLPQPQRRWRCACLSLVVLLSFTILSHPAHAQAIPSEITVSARVNTGAVSGDADDPAIWIHPTDPAQSLVIGTDKVSNFLYVWDMNGQELQRISVVKKPNNVDVRSGMIIGGAPVDICVVNAQSPSRLVVFKIDPATRTLINISAGSGVLIPELKNPYGLCLYQRSSDGAMFAFGTTNGGDQRNIHQYRLLDNGAGQVTGIHVRAFGSAYISSVMEGLVADDELGYVYASEEDCCVHKFYADPALNNNTQLAAFAQNDGIDPDREGLGIYGCANGTGYILLSSQGNKRVKVYRREGDPGNPHSHTLVTTIFTPDVGGTDGLDVTNMPAGPSFPYGLLVKHNSTPRNFALIAWEDIAKTYLTICAEGAICPVTADFSADVTAGCASLTVNFTDLSTSPSGVTSWSWDFGDGSTSTAQDPTHTYAAPGNYTVTLTAGSVTCSDEETKSEYISVGSAPTAAFAGAPTSVNATFPVNFTDQSTGNPTAWLWDFGDGGASTSQNPTHSYTLAGTYTVKLTVTNACGGDDETKTSYVVVSDCTPANVALGKVATASSTTNGDLPASAVDGSMGTKWKSDNAVTQWFEIDLGSTYETDNAFIRWNANRYANDFQFQYFDPEAAAWVTLYSETGNASSTSTFSFASTCAQRFRVNMTQGNHPRYGINELRIIGCPCATAELKANGAGLPAPKNLAPTGIALQQNYPNPFNPSTVIPFSLPHEAFVTLKVYNVVGEEVATLVSERRRAGAHSVVFEAGRLPSGIYFAVLQADEARAVQQLLLMK